jgi:hypothetical protein
MEQQKMGAMQIVRRCYLAVENFDVEHRRLVGPPGQS